MSNLKLAKSHFTLNRKRRSWCSLKFWTFQPYKFFKEWAPFDFVVGDFKIDLCNDLLLTDHFQALVCGQSDQRVI